MTLPGTRTSRSRFVRVRAQSGGDFGPRSNRHRPLRRRRGLADARPARTLATLGVYLRDPWSAVLVLRGMERGAMGHFCSVHALHLRMGKRSLATLGRGEGRGRVMMGLWSRPR